MGKEPQNVSLSSDSCLLQALLAQDLDQEVDIPHCQAKCLVFAQLLVWRVSGDEFPQLGKGAVNTLLPPSLPGVCEDLSGHVRVPSCQELGAGAVAVVAAPVCVRPRLDAGSLPQPL